MVSDKPTVSIIVPVYNVEQYLKECLDSIKNQTFKDWECILVDDGSKDSSAAMCDEYAEEDSRFRVIHKQNGGLSSARNAALKIVRGDYIGFVDADDWIEPEMFQTLYQLIIENNADISMVGYRVEYKGRHSTKHLTDKLEVIDREEAMRGICYDRLPNYVWNKLHKRSIITCDFPDGRNFEDIYVYSKWLRNVDRMVISPTPLYHYRMRRGSIIHVDPAKNRYDFFLSCIDRLNMMKDLDADLANDDAKYVFINKSAVTACKIIARSVKNRKLRIDTVLRIRDKVKEYPLPEIKQVNPKLFWRSMLLRNHPRFFCFLMRFVNKMDVDSKIREKLLFD